MRLKRLTISGFKSFPKRTSITFSHGVSAIVGPNGSGKSNIVDAIRWVLGEQNPRLLRARSMDDLIYHGHNGKAPGSAWVRLVLDNHEGMAPPELASIPEIEVERILFRNGDAKFRINRKNCRLKAIRYLFLDTGAGARAYSIIDQGQVGHFVGMLPRERREIVEEAAGISRYKARRAEAYSRMSQTSQNLERLGDIILEVEQQARSLKRQANRARRYVKLREDEENLSMFVLKTRWQDACHHEQELLKLQREQAESRQDLDVRHSSLDARLRKTDIQLDETRHAIKELKDKAAEIESRIDRDVVLVVDMEKQFALCQQNVQSLRKKLQEDSERRVGANKRLNNIDIEINEIEAVSQQVDAKEKDIMHKLALEKQAFSDIRYELETAKEAMVDLASSEASLKSKKVSMEERGDLLERRMARIDGEIARASGKLDEMERSLKDVQERIEKFGHRLDKESAAIKLLKHQHEDIRHTLFRMVDQEQKLVAEIAGLKAEQDTLKKVQAANQPSMTGIRSILGFSGDDAPMLADRIEVKKGWEEAVEAALSESLKALFMDNTGITAREIVRRLRESSEKSSMVSILSAQLMPEETPVILSHASSGFLPLADFIIGKGNAGSAARQILSGWYFADEIEQVLNFNVSVPGSQRINAITGDGFIVTSWNEIRFNGAAASSNSILWTRSRLLEIQALLSDMEGRLAGLKGRAMQAGTRQAELLSRIKKTESTVKDLQKQRDSLISEQQNIARMIDKLRNRMEVQEFEREDIQAEYHDIMKRLAAVHRQLQEISVKRENAQAGLRETERAFEKVRSYRNQLQQQLQKVSVERARLDTMLKGLQDEKKRILIQLKDAERLAGTVEAEIQKLSEKAEKIRGRIQDIRMKKQLLEKQHAALHSRISQKEEEMEGLMAARTDIEAQIRQLLSQISIASDNLHNTELKLSAIRKEKEHLSGICMNSFRKDIADDVDFPESIRQIGVARAEEMLAEVKEKIKNTGPVNLTAIEEFEEAEKRLKFLKEQEQDLKNSMEDIQKAIDRIDRQCRDRFKNTIEQINSSLGKVFPLLFEGGSARLGLDNPSEILESGVEFFVELPGKRIRTLNLLSGGEKALSALALIFAIFLIKPSPFCLLDEVDASLDDANIGRFSQLIRQIARKSQVILVTHNQNIMATADTLYGVTMEEKGISKLISVSLVQA